ncbi:MAG: hypothetical protein QXH55_02335 [Candidatus Korarchaeota archaeon]|nr:hypothetical protein [Thermoproteota archaeon]MCR8455434.1 hypothetical protein [Thermoproteota archaeon]MCR8462935.1 hypothetical protein [Thermoproteota archaeon]MCR8472277.1 hypothetical protein [Thermoproteota archaeon]MCR8473187.1 hypothetical protein [Thermoproteota archaeon]
MKSKNPDINAFLAIILTLMRVSETWSEIRGRVADMLEDVIDELDPETADRILSIAELLDNLIQIFEGRVKAQK